MNLTWRHFLFFGLAWGAQASAYSSPEPLPQGVRALAYVYGFASGINTRLNGDGLLEDLAKPLNRSVSIAEMAEAEPDLLKLQNVLANLDPLWADQVLSINLYAHASVFESQKVSGFLYGVTDRLAIGVIVPFIKRDIDFGFRADVVNNAKAIATSVGDIPELQKGLKKLSETRIDTQTFNQAIFLNRGYKAPESHHVEAWGDAEIETRYSYYFDNRWGLGLRGGFRAPTSSYKIDIRNVLDQDLTEDVWALKLSHLSEYQIRPHSLSWSTTIGGIVRLPKTQERAYARSASDPLPDLTDPYQIESVRKLIGPELNMDSGLQWSLAQGWVSLMGSAFYSVKAKDRIYGHRDLDYLRETAGTAAQTQGLELAVQVSSISSFRRNSFPLPFNVTVAYVNPMRGHDSIYAPYWRLDSVILF
ncbi:MAG: hypothetical protein ABIR96_06195 [Bdellovibrionota bacterium]